MFPNFPHNQSNCLENQARKRKCSRSLSYQLQRLLCNTLILLPKKQHMTAAASGTKPVFQLKSKCWWLNCRMLRSGAHCFAVTFRSAWYMWLKCQEIRHSPESFCFLCSLHFCVSMYCYKLAQLILCKGPIKLSVKSLSDLCLSFHVPEIGPGTTVVQSRISDVTGFFCVSLFLHAWSQTAGKVHIHRGWVFEIMFMDKFPLLVSKRRLIPAIIYEL